MWSWSDHLRSTFIQQFLMNETIDFASSFWSEAIYHITASTKYQIFFIWDCIITGLHRSIHIHSTRTSRYFDKEIVVSKLLAPSILPLLDNISSSYCKKKNVWYLKNSSSSIMEKNNVWMPFHIIYQPHHMIISLTRNIDAIVSSLCKRVFMRVCARVFYQTNFK